MLVSHTVGHKYVTHSATVGDVRLENPETATGAFGSNIAGNGVSPDCRVDQV